MAALSTLALNNSQQKSTPVDKLQDVHVEDGRALVGFRNGVVWVVGELGTTDDMTPEDTDFVSGLHIDNLG